MCKHNDEDFGCELCPDLFDEIVTEKIKHAHMINNEICVKCKKPFYEIMGEDCILENEN